MSFEHTFDRNIILQNTPNLEDLKVTLAETRHAGTGLFTTKVITKGEIVAFYKCIIVSENNITESQYNLWLTTRDGYQSRLIGAPYGGSVPPPSNNIPYWAHFANEPSKGTCNAILYFDHKANFSKFRHADGRVGRKKLKPGETYQFILEASREIQVDDEIVWCYGSDYNRDYVTSCKCQL